MKTWIAILLTLGLVIACGLLVVLTSTNLFVPMIVGTSVWAGIDSSRLHLRRFQSGISYGPVVLGILCSMFWIVGFPWYLSVRHKIITGAARLRPEFEPWDMASGQMSAKGLVQPWQGQKI
jgi:hypothetical protein